MSKVNFVFTPGILQESQMYRNCWIIPMWPIRRHKVFVSYYHTEDQAARDRFENLYVGTYEIMDSRSVKIGEIPYGLSLDETARRIRDDKLSDSTVTVVLIGKNTWRRKFVDWEIAGTIRDTAANPRSGLLGIFLPSHPSYGGNCYDPYTIPPRLHDNVECGFASLHDWSDSPATVALWIDSAYRRRNEIIPDNSHVRFAKNWRGERWYPQRRGDSH